MEVTPETTTESLDLQVQAIVENINASKMTGIGIASVFVKAHKWDQMNHGSSRWRKKEIIAFSCKVIDQTMESIDWELTPGSQHEIDAVVQGSRQV